MFKHSIFKFFNHQNFYQPEKMKIPYSLIFFMIWLCFSCSPEKDSAKQTTVEMEDTEKQLIRKVEPAPEWTALFDRSSGWFGGDGIFAIPLSGVDNEDSEDSIVFVFSDTMIGEIENGKLQPGYVMVNNSIAILKNEQADERSIDFFMNREEDKYAAYFTPQTPATKPDDYYWLGDGFANTQKGGDIYLFAYRIRNTNDESQFPFQEVGNSLLIIEKGEQFPFEATRQLDVPFFSTEGDSAYISFGVGLLSNTQEAGVSAGDGFLYIYGVQGQAKRLVAARVKPANIEEFNTWEFYTGSDWSNDIGEIAAISDSVSNELSVVPIADDQYALIYQYGGIFPEICMQVGPSPVGPFGPRQVIYNTQDDISDPDLFTYNAKAHPAISKPGELLVSYNVNSFKFFDIIESKPNLYRPRFIRISFEEN